MEARILTLARAMGASGPDELLLPLCRSACQALAAQLRAGVAPQDCGEAFPTACALMALSLEDRATGEVSSFSAGDVTIRTQGQNGLRQREALALLAPWLMPPGFVFQGVRG